MPIFSEYPAQTYAREYGGSSRARGWLHRQVAVPTRAGSSCRRRSVRSGPASLPSRASNRPKATSHRAKRTWSSPASRLRWLQAEANLAVAQANRLKAQQDFDRIAPLVKDDAAAKQELDAAVAALDAGKATVNANQANVDQTRLSTRTQIDSTQGKVEALRGALHTAELNLEYATIRAPISGLIGDTLVPVGGLVTANSQQPLTTIVPLDPMWVRFKVSEAEYLAFKQARES